MDPKSPTQPKRRRNASQFSAASFYDDADSRAPSSLASNCGSDFEDGDAYRAKRSRNNAAVRRSREKTKVKAGQAEIHLRQLRQENLILEKRERMLSEELNFLKESFMKQMTEHIERSRAFEASSANGDDNNNNNNNPPLVLGGDMLCLLSGVEKGFPALAAATIPAAAVATKDEGDTQVASVAAAPKVVDLKRAKWWRKNNNNEKNIFL